MILDAFKLDGHVALVTGGARGIGQALSLALAEAGADVVVLDRASLTDTCTQIEARHRRCCPISFDLREASPQSCTSVVDECVRQLGGLDILVNNAGIIRRAPALDIEPEDWDTVLTVNLTSAFYLSQAVARHIVGTGHGGKIINIASLMSFQGGVNVPAYAAAKSGLAGLTRALANEWAHHSINVNAIAPGWIATELTAELRADPARRGVLHARIPAGRWGEPSDLQGAVVFLASDAAGYIHGAVISVDGGWLAW